MFVDPMSIEQSQRSSASKCDSNSTPSPKSGDQVLQRKYPELRTQFPNMGEDGLNSFLRYIETDQFDVPLADAIDVLTIAKFYNIPALIGKCISLLKCSVSERNVVEVYQAGIRMEEKELYDGALAFIFRNPEKVINSPEFFSLTEENLCFLLERDQLKIDELALFNAVYRWGVHKCKRQELDGTPENLRMVLQKSLKRIRFPLLKAEQLTSHVAPKQVLTDAELVELYKYLSMHASQRVALLPSLPFPTKRREIRSKSTVYTIHRFEGIEKASWSCENKYWRIEYEPFRVNRSLSILGYGFLGAFEGTNTSTSYDIEIQLVGPKIAARRKEIVETHRAWEPFHAHFIEPVRIMGGTWYRAIFKFSGPPTLKASGPVESVSLHCGDIGRVNFAFRTTDVKENPAIHQLSQILFSF